MLDGPKRQHYLPRFYMDGFATDGLVAVYDRQKDEVRRHGPQLTKDLPGTVKRARAFGLHESSGQKFRWLVSGSPCLSR